MNTLQNLVHRQKTNLKHIQDDIYRSTKKFLIKKSIESHLYGNEIDFNNHFDAIVSLKARDLDNFFKENTDLNYIDQKSKAFLKMKEIYELLENIRNSKNWTDLNMAFRHLNNFCQRNFNANEHEIYFDLKSELDNLNQGIEHTINKKQKR